jgi:hypothetical protein
MRARSLCEKAKARAKSRGPPRSGKSLRARRLNRVVGFREERERESNQRCSKVRFLRLIRYLGNRTFEERFMDQAIRGDREKPVTRLSSACSQAKLGLDLQAWIGGLLKGQPPTPGPKTLACGHAAP